MEHNIKPDGPTTTAPRRPDLSSFFSAIDLVDTTGDRRPQNQHAIPEPLDIAAPFRLLAHAFEMMQGRRSGNTNDDSSSVESNALLDDLVEALMESADDPPRELAGVPDEFLAALERVPKTKLRPDDACPICSNAFLDDKYPLVVTLPCHGNHRFDLECISPWLKLNPTCPMDRQNLIKKKPPVVTKVEEEEEDGEYDDMFA